MSQNMEMAKELIKAILEDNYIGKETRFQYDSKMQQRLVDMNTGLKRACMSVIDSLSEGKEDTDNLVAVVNNTIEAINEGGIQEVE